jgi:hypothetical protein
MKMSARKRTGAEASPKEQGKLLKFSSNNSDVFAEPTIVMFLLSP